LLRQRFLFVLVGSGLSLETTNPMAKMTHAALASLLGPEFDDFLYASIDEDNGKLLSVLSALARLDVDPWRETAKLARLPKEAATQRLAALIAALPDESSAHRPVGTIAARLIALLPGGADTFAQPRQKSPDFGAMATPRPIVSTLLILMLIAFCGLLIRPLSTPGDSASPPRPSSIGTISPLTPPALSNVP
jgi:hypothetical protein